MVTGKCALGRGLGPSPPCTWARHFAFAAVCPLLSVKAAEEFPRYGWCIWSSSVDVGLAASAVQLSKSLSVMLVATPKCIYISAHTTHYQRVYKYV